MRNPHAGEFQNPSLINLFFLLPAVIVQTGTGGVEHFRMRVKLDVMCTLHKKVHVALDGILQVFGTERVDEKGPFHAVAVQFVHNKGYAVVPSVIRAEEIVAARSTDIGGEEHICGPGHVGRAVLHTQNQDCGQRGEEAEPGP